LRLLVAVARFGARHWRLISAFVGAGRRPSQCNQRWSRAIDPSTSHRSWGEDDDARLLRAVEILGKANWCQVARIVTRRTDLQCRYRYFQLVKAAHVPEKHSHPVITREIEPPPPQRRNSVSIPGLIDIEGITAAPVPLPLMLPYYLESSLKPRADGAQECLHRVPPMLFSRKPKP
jgi:hypothetical protein